MKEKKRKKENRAQKVRTDYLPLFWGGAATAPPPASIAAYCSRAEPSSDDAANTRCRPPRPPRRLFMTVRVTPPSPAVAASPLCSLFVTCCAQKKNSKSQLQQQRDM
jgi:hypothetical protein